MLAPKHNCENFNAEAFAMNIARAMETSGQALAAYLKPRERRAQDKAAERSREVIKTLSVVARILAVGQGARRRAADQNQQGLSRSVGCAMRPQYRRKGRQARDRAVAARQAVQGSEWKSDQFFDFVMQLLYLLTAQWAQELVKNADGIDPHTRKKAEFYVSRSPTRSRRQFRSHQSEVLARDAGVERRQPRSRHEDAGGRHRGRTRQLAHPPVRSVNLVVGVNMATTGQGDLPERADAADPATPTTEHVLRTPLLIVPPWINKFYILDLKPEKSYIKWCVDQGITVFVISWVNRTRNSARRRLTTLHEGGPAHGDGRDRKVTAK